MDNIDNTHSNRIDDDDIVLHHGVFEERRPGIVGRVWSGRSAAPRGRGYRAPTAPGMAVPETRRALRTTAL